MQQPFVSTSIWNMPIGSGATYTSAGMGVPGTFAEMPGSDPMRICLTPASPVTDVRYSSAGWTGANRCAPTSGTVLAQVAMPSDYVVPNSNKNECAAFLSADGHTVKQVQPLARCTAGTPATSIIAFPDEDLYEEGIGGAQGGSGLSALGGTLRLGELRPGQQGPPHALKVVIDTAKYLYEASTEGDTFRWPADRSDSGAVGVYGSETNNTNINMKMGSLLALHPSSTLPTTLRTEPGRQIAWTLQNYGAYVVDGTGADFLFGTEEGYHGSFLEQFADDWGYDFDRRANETHNWILDIKDIVAAFQVVTNNSESTVGGGGTPRVPLAADLGEDEPLPTLTFFTAHLNLQVITGDESDPDFDPENKGVHAGVTIVPGITEGVRFMELKKFIAAATLTPNPALIVLAPIRARIDDGRLKIRADEQFDIQGYVATYAALPTGLGLLDSGKAWVVTASGLVYVWDGNSFPLVGDGDTTVDQPDARLVAETAVLGLDEDEHLAYRVDFDHVTYNAGPQELPSFAFQAATTDSVVDLATIARIPL